MWLCTLARRNVLVAFAVISSLLLIFIFIRAGTQAQKFGSKQGQGRGKTSLSQTYGALSDSHIETSCKKHRLRPYEKHRKVYDTFLLTHDTDWLDIRLKTLSPYVDYFVVVESRTTAAGLAKPLYLKESWGNYTEFHSKIIYRIVDPNSSLSISTWSFHEYLSNSILHVTFPSLLYTQQEAHEGDVIVVSEIDEIPKPGALEVLRHCDFPDRLTLQSHFYFGSFQWKHAVDWPHPQATVYHGLSGTISPVDLRNGTGGTKKSRSPISFMNDLTRWWQTGRLVDAAWHCASCFPGTDETLDKHTLIRVDNNGDVPQYILDHKEECKELLGTKEPAKGSHPDAQTYDDKKALS